VRGDRARRDAVAITSPEPRRYDPWPVRDGAGVSELADERASQVLRGIAFAHGRYSERGQFVLHRLP
jgi:hypothetical protein